MPEFPTQGWFDAFVEEVNASEEYRKAAADWEGDIAFLVEAEPDKNVPADVWGTGRVAAAGSSPRRRARAPPT